MFTDKMTEWADKASTANAEAQIFRKLALDASVEIQNSNKAAQSILNAAEKRNQKLKEAIGGPAKDLAKIILEDPELKTELADAVSEELSGLKRRVADFEREVGTFAKFTHSLTTYMKTRTFGGSNDVSDIIGGSYSDATDALRNRGEAE